MPYEISLNVLEILKSTLYLLENSLYPSKESNTVIELKKCIRHAIVSLETELAPKPAE